MLRYKCYCCTLYERVRGIRVRDKQPSWLLLKFFKRQPEASVQQRNIFHRCSGFTGPVQAPESQAYRLTTKHDTSWLHVQSQDQTCMRTHSHKQTHSFKGNSRCLMHSSLPVLPWQPGVHIPPTPHTHSKMFIPLLLLFLVLSNTRTFLELSDWFFCFVFLYQRWLRKHLLHQCTHFIKSVRFWSIDPHLYST